MPFLPLDFEALRETMGIVDARSITLELLPPLSPLLSINPQHFIAKTICKDHRCCLKIHVNATFVR